MAYYPQRGRERSKYFEIETPNFYSLVLRFLLLLSSFSLNPNQRVCIQEPFMKVSKVEEVSNRKNEIVFSQPKGNLRIWKPQKIMQNGECFLCTRRPNFHKSGVDQYLSKIFDRNLPDTKLNCKSKRPIINLRIFLTADK